jgi:hypothetical protein
MIDCNKGVHAKQQPTNLYAALQEQATVAERLVNAMITSYIVLQEAMMPATMVDCDKLSGLCK